MALAVSKNGNMDSTRCQKSRGLATRTGDWQVLISSAAHDKYNIS